MAWSIRYSSALVADSGGSFDPGNPTFFDDFNYSLNRTQSIATKESIVQSAGWSGMKDENTNAGSARGWIYTVAPGDIEGHVGTFPGSSQRAMMFEAQPDLDTAPPGSKQTSYHINRWDAPIFPANLWLRFWIYIVDSGSMQSTYDDNNKFLYPKNTSGTAGVGDFPYLMLTGRLGSEHLNPAHNLDPETAPTNELYLSFQGANFGNPNGVCINSNGNEGNTDKLYQNVNHATRITPNAWYEVTLHIDTASVTGMYEAWIRPRNGARLKVAEWIGGVTSGLTFTSNVDTRGGTDFTIIPESVNQNPDPVTYGDGTSYTLFQDWAEAASFDDLPTYADEP